MQTDTIKEERDSCEECQSSSSDRAIATKHELPEPFAFVSIKQEVVSVGFYNKILYEKLSAF
jgi:hypothetical protein